MTMMKQPVICMRRSALPVLEGSERHQRSPWRRLSVTVTMVLPLAGSFKSRLFNVKVTSVTPRSNLVVVAKKWMR